MELRAEVRIKNRHTGSETILCTNVSVEDAIKWVNFSLKTMDYSNMPEYIIKPMINNVRPLMLVKKDGEVQQIK